MSDNHFHRYTLSRKIPLDLMESMRGKAVWVMFNPSTATDTEDDPTIRNVIANTTALKCDELRVLNLLPRRATQPNDLRGLMNEEMFGNLGFQRTAYLDALEGADYVICAWGALVDLPFVREHLKTSFEVFNEYLDRFELTTACLSLTKQGHPKHPLYHKRLKGFKDVKEFDIKGYCVQHGF